MKKTFVAASAAVVAVCALSALAPKADAQVTTMTQPVQRPLAVKAGVFFPTGSHGSSSGGGSQFAVGADYAITKTATANPILPSVYVDYNGGTHNGGRLYTVGAGAAVRTYLGTPGTNGSSPYVGAGIGVYDISARKDGSTESKSQLKVGGKIFLGTDLSSGFFVEASYQLLPSVAQVNPTGLAVQVGYRF